MAGVWTRASILLRDNAGNIARVAVLIASAGIDPSGGAVAAIRAAIVAITKAVSPRAETGTSDGTGSGTAATSDFDAVEDRAELTFAAADGSTMLFEVPAPKTTCFLSTNTAIVNPTGTGMASYIGWIEDNAVSKYNQSLKFVKGIRSRKKQMKR
jgi:hypothetical protein